MKILVACEHSGVVSSLFRRAGHQVISCDLKPGKYSRYHFQGNVKEILHWNWDMIIAHPPCTYLCNSGVSHLYTEPGRIIKMYSAADFFYLFWNHPCKKICIENPIPHKYACLPDYTQIIQPWQFGHCETKKTCLWLKGLKPLDHGIIRKTRRHTLHELSPGPLRSEIRSLTFPGIAKAMVKKWG